MVQMPFHLRFLLLAVASWLHRNQQDAIEYLREENRVLREMLGGRRLRFTDAQRKRLAVRGKELGRALLEGVATLVTPDTLLAWHRKLVARKWTFAGSGRGNAEAMKEITRHVVRMAQENPLWGYDRIQGALRNLGHRVCPSTVRNILRRNGIDPAPDRGKRTPWRTFLKAHAATICAADFFTNEVWTLRGLVTQHTLFVIHHATRRIQIVATTEHPDEAFMVRMAKVLTDSVDGFLTTAKFLILDRDSKFCEAFRRILLESGVRPLFTPCQAPNANAIAERLVRSVRRECTSRMIFLGRDALVRALRAFEAHYNAERNHQGIGNELIDPAVPVGHLHGRVVREERLGGLLSFYRRRSAA